MTKKMLLAGLAGAFLFVQVPALADDTAPAAPADATAPAADAKPAAPAGDKVAAECSKCHKADAECTCHKKGKGKKKKAS